MEIFLAFTLKELRTEQSALIYLGKRVGLLLIRESSLEGRSESEIDVVCE